MSAPTPVRLRLYRGKGFDLQANSRAVNGLPAVNVARPSPWGNPFVVGIDGDRARCVALYVHLLSGYWCLTSDASISRQKRAAGHVRRHIGALRGRNLACWCALPKPGEPDVCHAAVLLACAANDTIEARRAALAPILDALFQNRPTCEAAL